MLATFWFVPVMIIGLAVLLSLSLVSLDNSLNLSQEGWIKFFIVNSSDAARSILSTISGAMIGVAGTVFSITLVALTLASSQFGPRLIKNFMYVRLNQVVLGSYIATYLYCLLVLNAIKDINGYTFIPSISILIAMLAAIVNIVLLIIFIHQIATSIQADKVISDISDLISKQVESLFPEKMGDKLKEKKDIDEDAAISEYHKSISIKSPSSGYLQYIDSEALLSLVENNDSLFKLKHRPGSFLVKDGEIGVIYTKVDWEEESINELLSQFVFGKTRTSQQDLEYSIHQMVEIASRALSPGVNDPYTAIACINNLTATMCKLAQAEFPSKYRVDEDGELRVIADVLDFEGVLDAAFNQIRQFSVGSTSVIIRLVEALNTIQGFTTQDYRKKVIIKHVEMIMRLGKETIKEKNDLDDLKKRVNLILND